MDSETVDRYLTALIKQFLPAFTARMKTLEDRIAVLEGQLREAPAQQRKLPVKTKRVPRTYEAYAQVSELAAQGLEAKVIAERTGIPQSTVRSYMKMSEEEAEALRDKDVEREIKASTVGEAKNYMITECQRSSGEYGDAGWFEWTPTHRQSADAHKTVDGFPYYAPCAPDDLVTVMYANEYIARGLVARNISWGTAGGVVRFKQCKARAE